MQITHQGVSCFEQKKKFKDIGIFLYLSFYLLFGAYYVINLYVFVITFNFYNILYVACCCMYNVLLHIIYPISFLV